MNSRPMRVLGLMSGTSADGVDVALVRISGRSALGRRGTLARSAAELENFAAIPFPPTVRAAILRLAEGRTTTTGEISQLNFLLGELFARAALAACRRFGVSPRRVDLIGSHGQTVYHQGRPGEFLGEERVASTLQIGEPAVIAERTGITTVGDFRPADMAAGGQGAPLVPYVDYWLYRDARVGRVALNIGGIANLTVIPRAAKPEQVFAFDTGPGNMVIDALMRHFSHGKRAFDRGGAVALKGRLLLELLNELLDDIYFHRPPPKSAGREQYGEAYVERVLEWGRRHRARPADLVRTATVLTGLSIANAIHQWVPRRAGIAQLIVSGGGAHNPVILAQLRAGLPGIAVLLSGDFGVPEDAKEAFAFAILAYESYHGRPANLPRATGAKHPVVLGKVIRVARP